MQHKKLISFLALVLFVRAETQAGCSEVENLQSRLDLPKVGLRDIVDQALVDQPSISNAELAYENALDAVVVARSQRYPQTNLNLSYGRFKNPGFIPVDDTFIDSSVGVSSSLLLFDFGSARAQVKGARERARLAQASVKDKRLLTAMAAFEAYFDVLQERIALSFGLLAYQDYQALKAELVDSSKASDTDVDVVWSRKQGVCDSVRALKAEENQANNFFQSVLNYKPSAYFLIVPELPEVEMNEERSLLLAQSHHPAFKMNEFQKLAAEEALKVAKKAGRPKIYLDASLSRFGTNDSELGDDRDMTNGNYVGLRLSVPVTTGGRIGANKRTAERNLRSTQFSKQSLIRNVRRSLNDLIYSIENAQRRVEELTLVVEASQRAYNEMRANLFVNGEVDSQNLRNMIDERDRLYRAQVALNAQSFAMMLDTYNLQAQQGLLLD